MEGWMGEQ
ncbi:hypothetical protein KIPB_016890, partial [Kipferlia bialata]|eukprot:g16890.t1